MCFPKTLYFLFCMIITEDVIAIYYELDIETMMVNVSIIDISSSLSTTAVVDEDDDELDWFQPKSYTLIQYFVVGGGILFIIICVIGIILYCCCFCKRRNRKDSNDVYHGSFEPSEGVFASTGARTSVQLGRNIAFVE